MSNALAVPFSARDFSPASTVQFRPPELHGPMRSRYREDAPLTQSMSPAGREEVPVDELVFCHLQTAAEISRITHLREELQLPASVLADPSFELREKKEISTASSVPLPCAGRSLAPFASSR